MLRVEERELQIVEERIGRAALRTTTCAARGRWWPQTRALLPPLEQQLDAVNDQLAVLMGKSPAEARMPPCSRSTSLHLPEELPLSLPSALVRQRPDIRAAEALLHEASANVGVATANLYPQIVLSGSGGGDRDQLCEWRRYLECGRER